MKKLTVLTLILIAIVASACSDMSAKAPFIASKNSLKNQYQGIDIPKISVQLWSVKDELKADFTGTLKKIAGMGFDGVEFAGDFGPYDNDAQGLKDFLNSIGLTVSAAHVRFESFNDKNFAQSVNYFKTLQTNTLIIPWDERAWTTDKVDSLITDLNALFIKLKAEGFHFGFHNHDKEFDDHKGATFWDHIAKSTDKNFVLQLDIGWVTIAEKNPVTYITRYPGRTLTSHIKAKLPRSVAAKTSTNGKRPIVGDDVTDWDAVLKAEITVGGTKWFVIEQEEYPDGLTPLQAVELSKKGLDKALSNLIKIQ